MKQAAIISLLLVTGLALADTPPKPGTFYKDSELDIRKREVKNGRIFVTFSPKKERAHWCPGIKIKHTKKATVVTFVRAKASENGEYDIKAKYDRKLLTQQVVIDTKNMDTYIRNGPKTFKKIYQAKKSSSTTKSKNTSKGGSEGSKESPDESGAAEETTKQNASTRSKWFWEDSPLISAKISDESVFAEDKMPTYSTLNAFKEPDLIPSISKPAKQKMLVNEFVLPAAD